MAEAIPLTVHNTFRHRSAVERKCKGHNTCGCERIKHVCANSSIASSYICSVHTCMLPSQHTELDRYVVYTLYNARALRPYVSDAFVCALSLYGLGSYRIIRTVQPACVLSTSRVLVRLNGKRCQSVRGYCDNSTHNRNQAATVRKIDFH